MVCRTPKLSRTAGSAAWLATLLLAVVAASEGEVTVGIRLRSNDMERARDLFERTRYRARQEGDTIVAGELRGGNIELRTRDGDIRIGSAAASELLLESRDGDIHVEITGSSRMDASTQDGDISIAAPSSLRASIDMSGEDVSIQGGFRIDGSVRNGHARGDLNGGGEQIRAHTNEGTVRLVEGSTG